MMKYILVGIPNAGKSTLGKRAAEALKLPFYDTDKLSVDKMKLKRSNFFTLSSACQVVAAQEEVLFEIVQKDEDAIIATGAILPVDGGLCDILPKIGIVIHIKRNIELARAGALGKRRMIMVAIDENGEPLPGTEINMSEKVVEKYATDLPVLEKISHFAVENNDDIESGVEKLIELITRTMD
ncbi:shikimate kinase [Alphaproteobacteria bacterium]|nr:shikimate kinase [Alphaproteobacteria bacterium]